MPGLPRDPPRPRLNRPRADGLAPLRFRPPLPYRRQIAVNPFVDDLDLYRREGDAFHPVDPARLAYRPVRQNAPRDQRSFLERRARIICNRIYVTAVGERPTIFLLERIIGQLHRVERRLQDAVERQQLDEDFLLEPLDEVDPELSEEDSDEEDDEPHENGYHNPAINGQ